MAAQVVEICEAIKTYVEAQTYSSSFNVYRSNFVQTDLKDTSFTNLWIYPATSNANATEIFTRDTFARRYTVNLHLTNYMDGESQEDIDAALVLTDELELSIENVAMAGFQMMQFESNLSGRPFFELEQAINSNVFHSIIAVEYAGVL